MWSIMLTDAGPRLRAERGREILMHVICRCPSTWLFRPLDWNGKSLGKDCHGEGGKTGERLSTKPIILAWCCDSIRRQGG